MRVLMPRRPYRNCLRPSLSLLLLCSASRHSLAFTNASNTNKTCKNMSWSDSTRDEALKRAILPLDIASDHKGCSGRVAVIGGSARYTGAPYYSAMAALQSGADLVTIFTAQEASLPLKSYSPEFMVQPVYTAEQFEACKKQGDNADELIRDMVEKVTSSLDHMHSVVIGPGLGRCPLVMKAVAEIIKDICKRKIPLILDADALYMLSQPEYRSILKGHTAIVTPNVVEYKRLMGDDGSDNDDFDGVIMVRKGAHDMIHQVNGDAKKYTCDQPSGKKRSGGIGDILSGTLGTMVAWNKIMVENKIAEPQDLTLACWTACCFVKAATQRAYEKKFRSMTAPDVLAELGATIHDMTTESKL